MDENIDDSIPDAERYIENLVNKKTIGSSVWLWKNLVWSH